MDQTRTANEITHTNVSIDNPPAEVSVRLTGSAVLLVLALAVIMRSGRTATSSRARTASPASPRARRVRDRLDVQARPRGERRYELANLRLDLHGRAELVTRAAGPPRRLDFDQVDRDRAEIADVRLDLPAAAATIRIRAELGHLDVPSLANQGTRRRAPPRSRLRSGAAAITAPRSRDDGGATSSP